MRLHCCDGEAPHHRVGCPETVTVDGKLVAALRACLDCMTRAEELHPVRRTDETWDDAVIAAEAALEEAEA